MYVSKQGDMDAMCDLEDRIASDTDLSEQALRQLMREAFLLEMERKRQMGEAMLSRKVAPLAIGLSPERLPAADAFT